MKSARLVARTLFVFLILLIGLDRTPAEAQTFTRTDLTGPVQTWGIATGDLNGDHKDDIVAASSNGLKVFLTPGPTFTAVTLTTGAACNGAAIGDVTGDGVPDIVAGCSSGLLIFRGHGDGTFDAAQTVTVSNSYVYKVVAIADMNKDGRNDIIGLPTTGSGGGLPVTIYRNTNNTTAGFQAVFLTQYLSDPSSIAIADYDGDGTPDIFIGDQSAFVVPIRALAAAPFYSVKSSPTVFFSPSGTDSTYFVDLGDYDGGGVRDDLAFVVQTGSGAQGTLHVCPNFGHAACTVTATPDPVPVGLSAGPFGLLPTIALLNYDALDLTVGPFAAHFSNSPWRMATGDFDGDGRVDIVVGILGPGLSVFLNTTAVGAGQDMSAVAGASHQALVALHGYPATGTWTEGALTIAAGANPSVTLGLGTHTLTYNVPALGQDTVTVTVTLDPLVATQEQLAAANTALAAANAQVSSLANQVTALTDQVAALTSQVASLTAQVSALTAQLAATQADKATIQTSLDAANQTIAADQVTIGQLNTDLASRNADIQHLSGVVALLTQQLTAANADKATLQTSLDAAHQQIAADATAAAALASQIATLNEQVTALTTQAADLTQQIAARDATIAALNLQITDQTTQISAANAQSATLAQQLQTALTDKAALDVALASANSDKAALQAALVAAAADKTALQAALTAANADKATLQTALTAANADRAALQSALTTANSDKAALQAALTTATSDKAALQAALTMANTDKAALQASLATAQQTIATLTAQNAALAGQGTTDIASASMINAAFAQISAGFVLPGATPTDQMRALASAVLNLPKGQLQQLIKDIKK